MPRAIISMIDELLMPSIALSQNNKKKNGIGHKRIIDGKVYDLQVVGGHNGDEDFLISLFVFIGID